MHRMFTHEETGFVSIGDGVSEPITFTLEQFLSVYPDYRLPTGVVGVNYEHHGSRLLYIVHREGGHSQGYNTVDPVYEDHIARFEEYKAVHADITHPLYGLSLEEQRRSLAGYLSNARIAQAGIGTDAYSPTERETFSVQLAEATAWAADNTAETPMLDAARKAGEDKAAQVAKVIQNNAQHTAMLAERLKIIRNARAETDAMGAETLRATFDAKFMVE